MNSNVKLGSERGTTIVETAMMLPILVLLIFGIIEFSLIMYDKAMITNASREACRYGVVFHADPTTGAYAPLTDAEITAQANAYLQTFLISFRAGGVSAVTTITPDYATRQATGGGIPLTVTVTYEYDNLVLPQIGNALTLGAETTMRMEGGS
jgi:Flp pilus assembly protein TadG